MEYEDHSDEYDRPPAEPAVPLPFASQWNDRLCFDIALQIEGSGESVEEVIRRHGVSHDDFLRFARDNTFKRKVKEYRDEIVDKGLTFRMKARVQAEALLATAWHMTQSSDVSPAVKADLIKATVKWADLEPRKDVAGEGGGSGGVSIVINLGEETPKKVIDAEADI
jgi:hypothetical protein